VAGIKFYRVDLQVVVRRQDDGSVLISRGCRQPVGIKGPYPLRRFGNWLQPEPSELVPDLSSTLPLGKAVRNGGSRVQATGPLPCVEGPFSKLERVTLDIGGSHNLCSRVGESLDPVVPDAPAGLPGVEVRPRCGYSSFYLRCAYCR